MRLPAATCCCLVPASTPKFVTFQLTLKRGGRRNTAIDDSRCMVKIGEGIIVPQTQTRSIYVTTGPVADDLLKIDVARLQIYKELCLRVPAQGRDPAGRTT